MRSETTPKKEPEAKGKGQHIGRTLGQRNETRDNLAFKCFISHSSAT